MSPIDYRVPDTHVEGEVLGFRQWRVSPALELTSATGSDVWTPGTNTARCRTLERQERDRAVYEERVAAMEELREACGGDLAGGERYLVGPPPFVDVAPHPCPAPHGVDCDCGLYALHRPEWWYGDDATRRGLTLRSFMLGGGEEIVVSGLVVGWGAVEVHRQGWRAEHARVAALAVPATDARRREAVLARAVAADYGVPTVPQHDLERIAGEFGRPVPEEHRPEPPQRRLEYGILNSPSLNYALSSRTGITMRQAMEAEIQAALLGTASSHAWLTPEGDAEKPEAPDPVPGHEVPEPVAKARRARPRYDPRHFVAKRKGGHR
jgi:hypothetical protein